MYRSPGWPCSNVMITTSLEAFSMYFCCVLSPTTSEVVFGMVLPVVVPWIESSCRGMSAARAKDPSIQVPKNPMCGPRPRIGFQGLQNRKVRLARTIGVFS